MSPNSEPTRTLAPTRFDLGAPSFDPALDAGLAAAFGPDSTHGGLSMPPLLRDDPSENAPLVQQSSPSEIPRGGSKRYQLLGEIARGGMGIILKGRDPRPRPRSRHQGAQVGTGRQTGGRAAVR